MVKQQTKVFETSSSKCPECDYEFDAACGPEGIAGPNPGDLTICIRCALLMAFREDMTSRAATEREFSDLTLDSPEVLVAWDETPRLGESVISENPIHVMELGENQYFCNMCKEICTEDVPTTTEELLVEAKELFPNATKENTSSVCHPCWLATHPLNHPEKYLAYLESLNVPDEERPR